MTEITYELICLVWLHFLADFVWQDDATAKGKSDSNAILFKHVSIYTVMFLPTMVLFFLEAPLLGAIFSVMNGGLHFITDYFSSRATKKAWLAGERHKFFVIIGLDQAVHMTCLILTYMLFKGLV